MVETSPPAPDGKAGGRLHWPPLGSSALEQEMNKAYLREKEEDSS